MAIKKILLGLALATSVAVPTLASAQYYGGYNGGYGYHEGYRFDGDRRDWHDRERARWEHRRAEERRREYWQAQRYRYYHRDEGRW